MRTLTIAATLNALLFSLPSLACGAGGHSEMVLAGVLVTAALAFVVVWTHRLALALATFSVARARHGIVALLGCLPAGLWLGLWLTWALGIPAGPISSFRMVLIPALLAALALTQLRTLVRAWSDRLRPGPLAL